MGEVIRRRCNPPRRPPGRGCCVRLKQPPQRPDPAIYSQAEQFSIGAEPTWESPDIATNDDGWKLMAESTVIVRNLSNGVSAVNTLVQLSHSAFGIGMARKTISAQLISLAPGEKRTLLFALPQAVLNGVQLISVFVDIQHPTDERLANNHGEQAIAPVATSEEGRSFSVGLPVRNTAGDAQTVHLQVLGNELNATVSPGSYSLGPFQQAVATVSAHVPGSLQGSPANPIERTVTVVARNDVGNLLGGVTYKVRINS